MKTEIENLTPVYELIPMSDIDIEARKIAVAWVEQYGTMGFDIQNKHKLASDIMNYHRQKVAQSVESKTDIVDEEQEAIKFGEWLRTFEPLEKKDGFWVLESQISTKQLYNYFKNNYKLKDIFLNKPVAPVDEDELWDEVENIFDKNTAPTGGGYEADYTDKRQFIKELKSKFSITRKQ